MFSSDRAGFAMRRLVVASVTGAVTVVVASLLGADWAAGASLGWCALALVVLAWTWGTIANKDADATMKHARAEDFSRATGDLTLLTASVASLIAVGYTLVEAGGSTGRTKALLITLALATVVLAWMTVHTLYTVRYGDIYYGGETIGGISFNEDDPPDYHDFAYLAITIGMTFQVSDTDLGAKILRRTALRHALLSYVFGAVIGAVMINVVASLLSS
jgi:uncharacterized membrane protein